MRVIIIGTSHVIQHETWWPAGAYEPAMAEGRNLFAKALQQAVERYNVQRVAEEGHCGFTTLGRAIIGDPELWRNVNMPPWYHTLAGIPTSDGLVDALDHEKLAMQRAREAYIFSAAIEFFKGASCGLLVVGSEHVLPLVERFQESGVQVTGHDQRDEPWWRSVFEKHINPPPTITLREPPREPRR
jgi:hypothetical protein